VPMCQCANKRDLRLFAGKKCSESVWKSPAIIGAPELIERDRSQMYWENQESVGSINQSSGDVATREVARADGRNEMGKVQVDSMFDNFTGARYQITSLKSALIIV
jgi:hypothetical protein